MKSFSTALILVLGALQAGASPVKTAGPVCKGEAIAQKSSVKLLGGKLTMTNYKCPEGFSAEFSPVQPQPVSKREPESSLELDARQRRLCQIYQPPICQSQALCNNNVCNSPHALIPTQSDCRQIENLLAAEPGTFLTDPLTYWELPSGTCIFRWANNQASGILEYSYAEWATVGSVLYTNCITTKPGRNGGYCTPYTYAYWAQTTYVTFGLPGN